MISELHRQQSILLYTKTRSMPARIVNLIQSHIRPIMRGKARAAVEFGAKISVPVRNGFAFLHRISWDPYNEAEDLITKAKKDKQEYGCYPERICADRIYINTKNRNFCTKTTYGFLARDWEGPRKIKQSLLPISSSSMQISGGEMRWKDALDQGRESTLLI